MFGAAGSVYTHATLNKRLSFVALLSLVACAEGGEDDRPESEVQINATHHLFGLRSLAGFGQFPVPTNAVLTDKGALNLFSDSTYTVTRNSGTSGSDRYALADEGDLAIYVTGSNVEPSQVFLGGYGLVDESQGEDRPDYFFTDRVISNSSPSIGMYFGTRVKSGQVELEGGWHLLSLHVVFDQTMILSPENVGRGAHGGVTIDGGDPGTLRTISGTGSQGTSSLALGGSIQNLLDGQGVGDGSMNLTLDYQLDGQAADIRIVQAAGTDTVIFGVDENSGDGEAGLVTLIRKFDAPAAPVDSVRVLGTFLVGGHTLFVNPSNSGSDAFVGEVTLGASGAFRLDGVGSNGADFTYTGTYSLAADGGMSLSIDGTNETWFAAIDRSYNTFAFIDDFEELRPNSTPELNFGFGVRKAEGQ